MRGGYAGKIAFVDLTSGEIQIETLDQNLGRDFIGGQGLGARILFERQAKGVDPLGDRSYLGFTAGPLTGTRVPTGYLPPVTLKIPPQAMGQFAQPYLRD